MVVHVPLWRRKRICYLTGNGTADVDTGIYEGNGNDDYLISPSISLKKNTDYRLTFDTYDQWMP